jgi:hypothetical protein
MLVRDVLLASSPNAGADPGERRQNHIDNCAQREELHGAVARGEFREINTKQAVRESHDAQANEAGGQKRSGKAHETKNGNSREEAESHEGGEVAFPRKGLERRSAVGNDEPSDENHGHPHAGIDTGANGRVLENVESAIPWKMSTDSDQKEAPDSLPKFKPGSMEKVARLLRRR